MSKYSNQDHYLDPETGILKNIKDISDPDALEQYEAQYAAIRSFELRQNPLEGELDLDHLCAIHRNLFGNVYDWAGEIRDIDITKGNSSFAHYEHIESYAKSILEQLAQEDYLAGLDEKLFSERAAHYLGEINALHPFREGNGRTQRVFISHLAYRNGYSIEWARMSQDDMLKASIESFQSGDNTRFAEMILLNLKTLESTRNINQDTGRQEQETEAERKAREEAAARAERLAQFDRMRKEAEERQKQEQEKSQERTLER